MAPPGLHWCLAPDIVDSSSLGSDGHPHRGSFLPPIPLPRRMWASGEVRFLSSMFIGDTIIRRSIVKDIAEKDGRSGRLSFVTVGHEFRRGSDVLVSEDQVIVYREPASATAIADNKDPEQQPQHQWIVPVDSVMLFRYSALTFNSHRIHYDLRYAIEEEGYTDIVIHGPLQATLLLNLAASVRGRSPVRFAFRAARPAIGTQRLRMTLTSISENESSLSVTDSHGKTTMHATAWW